MKKYIVRITALFLIAAMLILPLSSCSSGKKMLTLKVDGKTYSISVNIYELMLSATKGTLDAYNYTLEGKRPSDAAFWDIRDTFDGTTYETSDDYYRKKVLEDCKTYLLSLYLFDKYNLELSESAQKEIDDMMDELVQMDGEGSKTKLNSVLWAFTNSSPTQAWKISIQPTSTSATQGPKVDWEISNTRNMTSAKMPMPYTGLVRKSSILSW